MLERAWKPLLPALIDAAERGRIPDALLRFGVRRMVADRAARIRGEGPSETERFVAGLVNDPIAWVPDHANQQHYELPVAFFQHVLGPHMKYSGCLYEPGVRDLEGAERAMLEQTIERAEVEDGMRVLDLGCGWGSFSFFCAERLPGCRVTAVSNSKLQREHILARARERNLDLTVLTADMNVFDPGERFDRIVSIEMFEHMRNWPRLLARIGSWLEPEGRLFVHHFCHARAAYPYEIRDEGDWMARYFFTGGLMPSLDLLGRFDKDLRVAQQWTVEGSHYQRTLLAWLHNLDERRSEAIDVLGRHYGPDQAHRWFVRWRLFLLGCAELFGYQGGCEWMVAHHLLEKQT